VTSDQQALPRNVIDWGVLGQRYRKKLSVEVYLTKFELLQNSDPKTLITGQFSRVDTVGELQSTAMDTHRIQYLEKFSVYM